MTATRPQLGAEPGSRSRAIARLALPLPIRVGLVLLLAAVLFAIWRPIAASPQAIAVANQYLAEKYKGYTVVPPANESRLFGTTTLIYQAEHQGSPARIAVSLALEQGQLVVQETRLYIGSTDNRRFVTWFISLAATIGMVYLVFFVSIPRTFGRKCPRDLTLLTMTEAEVVPPQVSTSGIDLAPVIERTYSCRVCDFRHCEALIDPNYRSPVAMWGRGSIYVRNADEWEKRYEERRKERAITDERYKQLLDDAKEAARAKSSTDSTWLYRS